MFKHVRRRNLGLPLGAALLLGVAPAAIGAPAHASAAAVPATVYVTNASDGTLNAIDVASGTVTKTITLATSLGVGVNAEQEALSHDGARLYVLAEDPRTNGLELTQIDTHSGRPIAYAEATSVATGADSFALSPDGTRAFVVSGTQIVVVDTRT